MPRTEMSEVSREAADVHDVRNRGAVSNSTLNAELSALGVPGCDLSASRFTPHLSILRCRALSGHVLPGPTQ